MVRTASGGFFMARNGPVKLQDIDECSAWIFLLSSRSAFFNVAIPSFRLASFPLVSIGPLSLRRPTSPLLHRVTIF